MKTVSQLDAAGYFVSPVVADKSPREPGVFLIPGGAIDVPPPQIPAGKVALWQGGGWAFVLPPDEAQKENPPIDGVPQVVSARQAWQALILAGLIDQVQPAIDAIADPVQRRLLDAEWNKSQEFHRDRPSLIALATAIGLSSEQLDDLFTQAAQL